MAPAVVTSCRELDVQLRIMPSGNDGVIGTEGSPMVMAISCVEDMKLPTPWDNEGVIGRACAPIAPMVMVIFCGEEMKLPTSWGNEGVIGSPCAPTASMVRSCGEDMKLPTPWDNEGVIGSKGAPMAPIVMVISCWEDMKLAASWNNGGVMGSTGALMVRSCWKDMELDPSPMDELPSTVLDMWYKFEVGWGELRLSEVCCIKLLGS